MCVYGWMLGVGRGGKYVLKIRDKVEVLSTNGEEAHVNVGGGQGHGVLDVEVALGGRVRAALRVIAAAEQHRGEVAADM